MSLDADLYNPILEGLKFFWPQMAAGGYIMVHDYNNAQYPGVKRAVREFCESSNTSCIPVCDTWGSAILGKENTVK